MWLFGNYSLSAYFSPRASGENSVRDTHGMHLNIFFCLTTNNSLIPYIIIPHLNLLLTNLFNPPFCFEVFD